MRILRKRLQQRAPDGGGGGDGTPSGVPPASITPPPPGQPAPQPQPGQPPPATPPAAGQPPPAAGQPGAPPSDPNAPVTMAQLTQWQNSFFASLRRAGALRGEEPPPATPPARRGQSTDPPTSVTPADVEAMLERRGAFERTLARYQVNDAIRGHAAAALAQNQPEDVAAWTQQYMTDWGVPALGASSPPTNGTPSTTATTPGQPPVTGGAAAGGTSPDAVRDPYNMTQDDVDALIRQYGWHGAGTKIMESIRAAPRRRLLVRKRS